MRPAGSPAAPALLGTPPSSDDIITAWAQHNGDPNAAARHLGLSIPELLRLIADPAIARQLDTWQTLRAAHFKMLALQTQATTASHLCEKLRACDDITESRRAAAIILRWFPFPKESPAAAEPVSAHSPSRAQPTSPVSTERPVAPEATPQAPATPDFNPDLRIVVSSLLDHVQAHPDPLDIAQRLAPQLAPFAALGDIRLPPVAIRDADLLADLIEDSALADVAASEITGIETLELSETTASIRLHCNLDPVLPITVDLTLTRDSETSPWLITSISPATRPAPVPQSASP